MSAAEEEGARAAVETKAPVTINKARGALAVTVMPVAAAYGVTMGATGGHNLSIALIGLICMGVSLLLWLGVWGRRSHPILQTRFGLRAVKLGIMPKVTSSHDRDLYYSIAWIRSAKKPMEWLETPDAVDRAEWVWGKR